MHTHHIPTKCLCTCPYRTVGSEASSEQEPKDENCSLHWQPHGSRGEGGESCYHSVYRSDLYSIDHHLDSRHNCPGPKPTPVFYTLYWKQYTCQWDLGVRQEVAYQSVVIQCSIHSGAMSSDHSYFQFPPCQLNLSLQHFSTKCSWSDHQSLIHVLSSSSSP